MQIRLFLQYFRYSVVINVSFLPFNIKIYMLYITNITNNVIVESYQPVFDEHHGYGVPLYNFF